MGLRAVNLKGKGVLLFKHAPCELIWSEGSIKASVAAFHQVVLALGFKWLGSSHIPFTKSDPVSK